MIPISTIIFIFPLLVYIVRYILLTGEKIIANEDQMIQNLLRHDNPVADLSCRDSVRKCNCQLIKLQTKFPSRLKCFWFKSSCNRWSFPSSSTSHSTKLLWLIFSEKFLLGSFCCCNMKSMTWVIGSRDFIDTTLHVIWALFIFIDEASFRNLTIGKMADPYPVSLRFLNDTSHRL